GTVSCEQDRPGAFAENHSARRFLEGPDWRRGTEQAPFAVSVAGKPISFFGGDNEAVVEAIAKHEIVRHFESEQSDRAVADEGVARAGDAEDGGEMAGGRVENGFGKEERARSLGAGFDDVVIEAFRVDHAAIRDGEDESN